VRLRPKEALRFGRPALGIGGGNALTLAAGVPEYLTIDGVLARLLKGRDEQPLKGRDGQYLYGVAA